MGFWDTFTSWLEPQSPDLQIRSAPVVEQVLTVPLEVLPPSRGNTSVTAQSALSLPAVYAAVDIITIAVSQLKLGAFRGDREIPTPALLRKPDIHSHLSRFLKRTALNLVTQGNAYWRIYRREDKSVVSVYNLDPNAVYIHYDKHGKKLYGYGNETFTAEEVYHLKRLEVAGTPYGLGPIQAARVSLAGALDLREYGSTFFQEAGVPTGVLTTTDELDEEQATLYKTQWIESQRKRSVAVLGKGLTYEPVVINPKDAQFIESQNYSVREIATLFRVPAIWLNAEVGGTSTTYTNMEESATNFIRFGLMAYLGEIEEAFTELLPRGLEARFRLDNLLRADSKTRSENYQRDLSAGWRTTNEIRALEALPPLETQEVSND